MKTKTVNLKTKKLLAFLMALVMALTSFPLMAFATDESGPEPAPGTSQSSPFVSGQPSDYYRIPNLITLDDGTLIAQADARWTADVADGGGNDSIVARSTDGGATWNYQMLTYYPDNGNQFNRSSTSICDSALATDGKMVYTLSTFFPAGYSINISSANYRPVGDKAFDDSGRLLLSRTGESGYNYYLDDFNQDGADGRAQIMRADGTAVEGYTVDHDFYLYNNGAKSGTLFYSDCEFQTVKTTFLVFRSSSDGGQTWTDMKLVNVKNSDEQFCGVGPGRGVVTSDGTIIFGVYSWNGTSGSQASSFIYSDDNGQSWKRTESLPDLKYWIDYTLSWNGTSECQPVELDDGTIRLFCRTARRRMVYADAKKDADGNYYWINADADGGGPIHLDSVFNGQNFDITENNQYSVIKYSKKVLWDGNYYTMLIASHANDGSGRNKGTLTFLLLNTNNDVVNAVQQQITTGGFAYSCLTELPNGNIALLYEDNNDFSTLRYVEFTDMEDLSSFRIPDLQRTYNINLVKRDTQTYTADTDEFTNSNPDAVSVEFTDNYSSTAQMGSDANFDGQQIPLTDALYTFTQTPEGQWYVSSMGVHLTIDTPGQPSTKDRAPITINRIGDADTYFQFVDDRGEALYMWRDGEKIYQFDQAMDYRPGEGDHAGTIFKVFRPCEIGEESSVNDPVPGYVEVDQIVDGGKYLIGCEINGSYYFLYPSLSSNNVFTHTVKGNKDYVQSGYDMTFTALAAGTATVVCGSDTYIIEVSDYSREITGVVDYDPVIYTHGAGSATQSEITTFGSSISDGSVTGEKVTNYKINDNSYTIIGIDAVEAFGDNQEILENSTITPEGDANGGKLTGTLALANDGNYNSYESGTYVTLKTTLQDSTGLLWTQTDRLYVASNPVPGHVLSGNCVSRYFAWAAQTRTVALSTFVLAEGSYGNTTLTRSGTLGDYAYVGNAIHLYPEDGIMHYNGEQSDISIAKDNNTEFKGAGVIVNNNSSGDTEIHNLRDEDITNNVNVAYYYYDKSSDKNEGITQDPTDPSKFSLVMKRQPVNIQYTSNNYWSRNIKIGDGNRSYIQKLSGDGEIETQYYMFGGTSDGNTYYDLPDNDETLKNEFVRSATVNCTTYVTPNTTQSLRGEVQYQEGAEPSGSNVPMCWNNVSLTFEIKMCDKSEERTPYDEAMKSIKKSTWYTTDTWYNYMNALLIRQEYLNNYTLLTTAAEREYNSDPEKSTYEDYFDYQGQDTIELTNNLLTKRADFSPLENALEDNLGNYQQGIELSDGTNWTPDSYKAFLEAYENGQALMADEKYDTEDERNNTPGYVTGPDVDTSVPSNRLDIQVQIEDLAQKINDADLVLAADDEVYVAVKNESERIDKTAYTDKGQEIETSIQTGDGNIYEEYDGVNYVNIPQTEQATLDGYTKDIITDMNVGANGSAQVKKYDLTYSLDVNEENVVDKQVTQYNYGETATIDLSDYNDSKYTVKCMVTSETGGKEPTPYNLEDSGYVLSILIQEDITVEVEVTENEAVVVEDYYGDVLGIGYIPADGSAQVTVDSTGRKITINGTEIVEVNVKDSPRYAFVGWSLADDTYDIDESTVIHQRGSLLAGEEKVFTAVNGTINGGTQYATTNYNMRVSLVAPEGSIWTREVDGVEYLASYDSSFINYTANENVTYKAYEPGSADLDASIANQIADRIPAVFGAGYFANEKFTLSVDYSAPQNEDVTVVEAGIICSNDPNATPDTLKKGEDNAFVVPANAIAHWNGHNNSGTFTMTLKNSGSGVYYMRAYVSYVKDYNPGDDLSSKVPYVTYCERVYKCENGTVSAIN